MSNKKQKTYHGKILSFKNFLYYYHKAAGLINPTKNQYEIAKILEDCAVLSNKTTRKDRQMGPRVSDKIFINTYRGFGKSHIASLFVSWLLYRNNNLKCLLVSGTNSKSSSLSYHILQTIKLLPELSHLAPKDKHDRAGSKQFDVAGIIPKQQPSVSCTSISANNTGMRADVLILDDIETLSSAYSSAEREEIEVKLQELTGAVLSPNALVIVLGTFQSDESIYIDMIEERGYSPFFLPVAFPPSDFKYSKFLLPNILNNSYSEGQPLDRFSTEEINKRKVEYSEAQFALQFMLDTTKADKEQFEFDLNTISVVSSYGQNKIMVIDPSSGGSNHDASAYVILAYGDGKITILHSGDCGGFSDDSMLVIMNRLKEHNVKEVHVESNFGAGMFSLLLSKYLQNNNYPCKVVDFRVSGNKNYRISSTLAPAFKQNLLCFHSSYRDNIENNRTLRFQIKNFRPDKLKYDDHIDCLASAVSIIKNEAVISDKSVQRMNQYKEEQKIRIAIYGNTFGSSNFITNRI